MKAKTPLLLNYFSGLIYCGQIFSLAIVGLLCSAPDALAREQRSSIEEVLVTAQKREESLQDAPVSVTAFTAADLDVNHAIEAGEIVNQAPNVTLRKNIASHSNYAFGVRGVTSGETALTIDSVLAVYADGVYLGRLTGSAFDISDTERIEVLRGPQGTLYGRNATGGAINIISAKPDRAAGIRNHFSGGERGFWRNQLTINTGSAALFGGEFSMRLNSSKWNHRGTVYNEGGSTGYIGDQDSEASKAHIRFASDRFEADYIYTRSTKIGNAQTMQLTSLNDFSGRNTNAFWNQIQSSGYVSEERLGRINKFYDQPESSDVEGHSFIMSWDLPAGYKLKSITGVREWDSKIPNLGTDFGSFIVDGDSMVVDHLNAQTGLDKTLGVVTAGQAVSLFTASRDSSQEQYSQEFQLSGISFNGKLDWVFGAYYFEEKADESNPQATAVPGTALPFTGGVASAFDGDQFFPFQIANVNTGIAGINAALGMPNLPAPQTAALQAQLAGLQGTLAVLQGTQAALTGGADQAEAAVRAALTARIPVGTPNRDIIIDAQVASARLSVFGGVTDPLGLTFQGRGNNFLCTGASINAGATGAPVPAGITDISANLGQPAGSVTLANACAQATVLGGAEFFDYGTDNQAWALYWHGRAQLIDSVTLSIGVRYTEDDRDAYLRYSSVNRGARIDTGDDWENFTWDVSVDWQIIPEVNFYGRIANSYRSGGYNARSATAAEFLSPFDEENIISYEVGVKSLFLDDKIRINASVYYSDYTDAQVSTFSPSLAGAGSVLTNAGELTLQGFELEFLAIPFTGFTVGLNLGILDAEYDQYAEGNATLTAQLQGNEPAVPYAPESNWALFVDYQFPTYSWGQIGLRLDGNYSDRFTISPTQAVDSVVNDDTDRTLVNFSVTLNQIPVPHGDFSIALWSRNITNERYREFVIPFGAFNVATYGELHNSGIDIVYTY